MATQISKYASLPDIDSAPDVYETPDVLAESTREYDSDSDTDAPRAGSPSLRRGEKAGAPASENIDSGRLDMLEARKRFGEADVSDEKDPFAKASTRISSRRLPSTRVYTTGGAPTSDSPREKETTLERLRRLRSEIEELESDVRRDSVDEAALQVAEPSGNSEDALGKGKRREVTPGAILQQLQLLRGDLVGVETTLDSEATVLEATGQRDGPAGLAQKAKQSSGLLSRLGLGGAGTPSPVDVTVPTDKKGTPPPSPSKAKPKAGTAEMGQLEKRVAEVEKVLGASEADIDAAHPLPPPLLQTLSRLDHLLTLLTQPRHLDSISRRVKVLVADLERLHESRRKLGDTRPLNVALSGGMTVSVPGAGDGKGSALPLGVAPGASGQPRAISGGGGAEAIPPDVLQKVDALFALLPRLDPLLPLTPRLLTRLRSLAALHSSASTFGDGLTNLQSEVERLGESERGLKQILEGLEGSMKDNEAKVHANLASLDEKFQSVVQRVVALSS